jgi:hypothetical protein
VTDIVSERSVFAGEIPAVCLFEIPYDTRGVLLTNIISKCSFFARGMQPPVTDIISRCSVFIRGTLLFHSLQTRAMLKGMNLTDIISKCSVFAGGYQIHTMDTILKLDGGTWIQVINYTGQA